MSQYVQGNLTPKSKIYICAGAGMQLQPSPQERRIPPLGQHAQDAVRATPTAMQKWCTPFPDYSVEVIGSSISEHRRCATKPGPPQQNPERVVVLDTKRVVRPQSEVGPQAARVKSLAVCLEQGCFNLWRTTCKPASQHVAPDGQRPSLPLDIRIVRQIIRDPVTQILESVYSIQMWPAKSDRWSS